MPQNQEQNQQPNEQPNSNIDIAPEPPTLHAPVFSVNNNEKPPVQKDDQA